MLAADVPATGFRYLNRGIPWSGVFRELRYNRRLTPKSFISKDLRFCLWTAVRWHESC